MNVADSLYNLTQGTVGLVQAKISYLTPTIETFDFNVDDIVRLEIEKILKEQP
jgi:hypothetical protein